MLNNSLYANKLVLYAIRHWQWIIGNQYFRVRNVKVPILMHHLNTHLKAKLVLLTISIVNSPCITLKKQHLEEKILDLINSIYQNILY